MIPVVDCSASNTFISKVRLCCIVGSCIGFVCFSDLRGLDAESGLEPLMKVNIDHAVDEPQTNLMDAAEELGSEELGAFVEVLDSEELGAFVDAAPSNKQVRPAMSIRSIVSCCLLLTVMVWNIWAMVEESVPKGKTSSLSVGSIMRRIFGKSKYVCTGQFFFYGIFVLLVIGGYLFAYNILAARGSKMSETDWFPFFSAAAEGFGILSLRSKIRNSGHATGISAKTVALFAMLYTDTAMDCPAMNARQLDIWACKVLEWVSLALVVDVLYAIVVTHRQTYQKELDVVPVKILVCICACIAFMYQPSRVSTKATTMGFAFRLYVDAFALVPQVVMMSLQDHPVHAPIAHFVAVSAMSRIFDMTYWMEEFHFWAGPLKVSFSGWLILGLHAASLFVVADFFYYYVKTWVDGRGFMDDVSIPSAMDV